MVYHYTPLHSLAAPSRVAASVPDVRPAVGVSKPSGPYQITWCSAYGVSVNNKFVKAIATPCVPYVSLRSWIKVEDNWRPRKSAGKQELVDWDSLANKLIKVKLFRKSTFNCPGVHQPMCSSLLWASLYSKSTCHFFLLCFSAHYQVATEHWC